jgi:hypothetical protein
LFVVKPEDIQKAQKLYERRNYYDSEQMAVR